MERRVGQRKRKRAKKPHVKAPGAWLLERDLRRFGMAPSIERRIEALPAIIRFLFCATADQLMTISLWLRGTSSTAPRAQSADSFRLFARGARPIVFSQSKVPRQANGGGALACSSERATAVQSWARVFAWDGMRAGGLQMLFNFGCWQTSRVVGLTG